MRLGTCKAGCNKRRRAKGKKRGAQEAGAGMARKMEMEHMCVMTSSKARGEVE